MKSYEDLTRLGKLRRMRKLAEAALAEYDLGPTKLKLYLQAGNSLYQVTQLDHDSTASAEELFQPGQFLLRIYQPGWQANAAIELELAWLQAMRREGGLPVPEPMPRADGEFLSQVSTPGIPEGRSCALLRWVRGRLLGYDGRPKHYRAQGRLMALIHNFTQQWQLPPGASKRHYDWDGLFLNDPEIGLEPGESWSYLPHDWVEPFKFTANQYRQLISDWGTGPDVYGLIHADMGLDANVLFYRGQPRIIDFDGSGFGYWAYDLAVALAHMVGKPEYPRFLEALLEGYAKFRHFPTDQRAKLDLFTAAFYVYFDLWLVGATHDHPERLSADFEDLMYRGAAFVQRFSESAR